jgi:hypothetical protein
MFMALTDPMPCVAHENSQMFPLGSASGALKQMDSFAEQCVADYEKDRWRYPAYHDRAGYSLVNGK